MCQCFHNAPLLHNEERCAVGYSPFFVRTLGIQGESGCKLSICLRDDFNIDVALEATYDLHRTLAERLAKRGIMIEELRQNHLAGNNLPALEYLACCDGFGMQLITWVEQGNPVAGMSEHSVHAGFLGTPYR